MIDWVVRQVLAVFQAVLGVFIGTLALVQFKNLYALMATGASMQTSNVYLQQVQEVLRNVYSQLETVVGPPHKLAFTFTHVILVGIIATVCIEASQLRAAVSRSK